MRARAAVFVVAAVVTSVFFIDFCNLVFQCGCRSLWAGADAHCNIHKAGVPHCPFCDIGGTGFWAAIIATQAATAFGPRGLGTAPRLALTLIMFPLTGGLLAVIAGWATGYWAGTVR